MCHIERDIKSEQEYMLQEHILPPCRALNIRQITFNSVCSVPYNNIEKLKQKSVYAKKISLLYL